MAGEVCFREESLVATAAVIVLSLLARFYERRSATGAATSVGKNFGALVM